MTRIPLDEGERHPYRVHLADTLNKIITEKGAKAAWLAHCLGISETLLSDYRSGVKAIPAYRAALVDELLVTNAMTEAVADIAGFHLVHKATHHLTADALEKLFPVILREEGAANADIAAALMDHAIDTAEQDAIHRHAAKLRRFWQDVEERTTGTPKLKVAR